MEQEDKLGYSNAYRESCKKNHIIYPDEFNEENEGYRAPYFYLHNEAERLAKFDCFSVSPKLLRRLLRDNVELAYMNIEGKTYELLMFSQYVHNEGCMKGYAVCVDDLEGIQDALEEYPNAFSRCLGHTPDEYLKHSYPETYKLLVESAYSDEYKKLRKEQRELGLG